MISKTMKMLGGMLAIMLMIILVPREVMANGEANIFTKTEYSVEQLEAVLENYPSMKGLGQAFKDMEEEYGVSALWAISFARHESGNGTSKLAKNNNNLFGMRGKKGWMSFKTQYGNIQYFGELMNKKLYKDKTLSQIGKSYCPTETKHWINTISKIHKQMKGSI